MLDHDKVAQAASVVARAFDDDPLNLAMFPDPAARARLGPPLFQALVRCARLRPSQASGSSVLCEVPSTPDFVRDLDATSCSGSACRCRARAPVMDEL